MTTQSTYTIEPHFMKLWNSSQEVFYIWELNTLYGCVKNQSHFGPNINIPMSARFTSVERVGRFLSTGRDSWVTQNSAGKSSTSSHFPSNMQKLHQENQIYFYILTLAIEKTSSPTDQPPASLPSKSSSFCCLVNIPLKNLIISLLFDSMSCLSY